MTSASNLDALLAAVLPVIDLQGGVVVRGVGGERESYQAVTSKIVDAPQPAAVATALKARFGFSDCYVADLDGIVRGQIDVPAIAGIEAAGLAIWLDAGLGTAADFDRVTKQLAQGQPREVPIAKWIVGLESLADLASLAPLLTEIGPERLVFSLDLKQGRPLSGISHLLEISPLELAREVLDLGVRNLILLDLAQVGQGQGTGTDSLLVALRRERPDLHLITGGGIQNLAQVSRQGELGADRVMIASAIHNGCIFPHRE
ncbi:MAG: HisA/HisF-related TIM barrel protein [Pirellulaceae bacterium]